MAPVYAHQQALAWLLHRLFSDGILNSQYQELQKLREYTHPGCMVEILTMFCSDSQQALSEIDNHSKRPYLGINEVQRYVRIIEEHSVAVGAGILTQACEAFFRHSEQNDIAECRISLLQIMAEYYRIEHVFEEIIWLERRIYNLEAP